MIKENTITTYFEPYECVIFLKSTKIGNHENKAVHSISKESLSKKDNLQGVCHDGLHLFHFLYGLPRAPRNSKQAK